MVFRGAICPRFSDYDDPKSFFNFAETWYADSLCRLNIFVFPDCRRTNFLWVFEGRLARDFSRMMMIQKVSSISLKLGTPTVYADLIFLYFQIAAEQTSYGFSRGDLPEIFPGFPGNSSNLGNLRGATGSDDDDDDDDE